MRRFLAKFEQFLKELDKKNLFLLFSILSGLALVAFVLGASLVLSDGTAPAVDSGRPSLMQTIK